MKTKRAVSFTIATILIIAVLFFSIYVSSSLSIFKKYRFTGFSINGDEKLLGIIGDRFPSNSFSSQFKVVNYETNKWVDGSCYTSALEACKAIYPGTIYVKETSEIAYLDLWNFKPCGEGVPIGSYIYLDYCYGNAVQENISISIKSVIPSNEDGFRSLCEKNYTASSWHSCPCSSDNCGSGSIANCETKKSFFLSLFLQQNMVKCKEKCTFTKITECNEGCEKGFTEVGKVEC